MMNSQIPLARKENLVIQEMTDEVLVYDMDTNKAHCLNQTAAFIWKACDGNNDIKDISNLFAQKENKIINEELIWLAIDQLNEKDLLENKIAAPLNGETRRSVIKKIGLAAVIALPVVASLTAPTSVLAVASCGCAGTVGATACGNGCAGTCQDGVPVNCN